MSQQKPKTYSPEAVTSLDVLVGMISRHADVEHVGAISSVTVRMPLVLACTFDAMAQFSGQSRNRILCHALEVAADELYSALPDADLNQINAIRSDLLRKRVIEMEHESGEI